MDKRYFIIDFDSTFIQLEGLEELANISLENNPKQSEILEEIKKITNLCMEGRLSFRESLEKRLALLSTSKADIEKLIKLLKRKISPSVLRNKAFFKNYKDQIYLITGGFEEFVSPIVSSFGIDLTHIIANKFIFDSQGKVTGFDKTRLTSKEDGKVKAVQNLNLKGEIIVIGDGFTDLQIKQLGAASQFVAFTENVIRDIVTKGADSTVANLDEFLFNNKLPMALSYPKSKIKVLLLENIEKTAVELFEKEGYQVELLKVAMDEDELISKIADVSILGIRSKTKVTRKVLEAARRLKVIGAFCIGTDQMDLKGMSELGVASFNAPYQNTRSVVELVLGEMIILMRQVTDKNNKLHQGIWDKNAQGSNEIRGKTLGIVGYGSIGTQVSILAENLGMDVIFYDKVEKLSLGNAKKAKSMAEVFKKADVVTIHVSGDKSNTNLIGEKEFSQMKEGAVFLNLSRGFIVDIKALAKYLKSGHLKGAGIDVFPKEPKGKGDPFESVLQGLANVIITPHIAGSTEEAQRNIAEFVTGKLIDFINTGNTYLSVNLPNISLPEQGNAHRLLHLHKNVPGILAQINNVMARHNINIVGQYLKTSDEVGYVITDVNKKYEKEVLKELEKIPDTIEFRVLY